MTINELRKKGEAILGSAGIEDARQDACYLLEEVLRIGRSYILLHGEQQADPKLAESYLEAIDMRSHHVPCQYITGRAYFMGLDFSVNENVLIPRQDTEVLAEQAIDFLRDKDPAEISVMDVCTGSGCIAVSLKYNYPKLKVSAIDISADALKVARKNAERILHPEKIYGIIEFYVSNLLSAVDQNDKFDLIVSNPPYVSDDEYAGLAPEIREHEPSLALLAGRRGMDIYEKLVPQAAAHLKRSGALMLEIGCSQGQMVSELMAANGFGYIEIVKDLAGLDRVVTGIYTGE